MFGFRLAPPQLALRRFGGGTAAPTPTPSPTPTPTPTITSIVVEGDSITFFGGTGGFARDYGAYRADKSVTVNAANSRTVGGSAWTGPPAEGADAGTPSGANNTLLLQRPSDLASGAQLVTTMIGTNDLQTFSVANYKSRLANWAGALRSAGVKVGWSAPPPLRSDKAYDSNGGGAGAYDAFTAKRAALLATCRDPAVWGAWADCYLPLGEHPDLNAADNTAYISFDGVHPVQLGHDRLLDSYKAAVDTLLDASRANATTMVGAAWPTSETNLATATQIVRRFVVKGLAHGGLTLSGANALNVTGGAQVRVNGGGWATSSTGWLYNGDVVELRLTTSAANATDTGVDLTVGTETRTLTYRTVAAVTPAAYVHGGVANVQPGAAVHSFTGLAFANAGVAVLWVKGGGAAPTGVKAGPAGTLLAATRAFTQAIGGQDFLDCWLVPVTAGTRTVEVTYAAFHGQTTLGWGAVTGADATPVQVDSAAVGYQSAPFETAALIVPASGVAVAAFGEYGGASVSPATANAGTTLSGEGSGTYQGETHGVAVGTRTASGAASWSFAFGKWCLGAVVFKATGT